MSLLKVSPSVILLLIVAACTTSPLKNKSIVESQSSDRMAASPQEALTKFPAAMELVPQPLPSPGRYETSTHARPKTLDLDFNSGDPVMKIENRMAPFKSVSFRQQESTKNHFLVVSGVQRSIGAYKQAAVIPLLKVFDSAKKEFKLPVAQVGRETGLCFSGCVVMAYPLESLPAGAYTFQLIADVQDPEAPVTRYGQTSVISGGRTLLPIDVSLDIYPNYFGSVELWLSEKLPLDSRRSDVKTRNSRN